MANTGGFKPDTKVVKLERANRILEQEKGLLTLEGNYRIDSLEGETKKELGTNAILVNFGKAGENARTFVFHPEIGRYYTNKPGVWAMSPARDLADIVKHKNHPALNKIYSKISGLTMTCAKNKGLLVEDSSGEIHWPGKQEVNRIEKLADAQKLRKLHVAATSEKQTPHYLSFMASTELAHAEAKWMFEVYNDPKYQAEVKVHYLEIALYNPSTDYGAHQTEVPYLYGMSKEEAEKAIFQVASTGIVPESIKKKEEDYPVASIKFPVYKPSDSISMSMKFSKALTDFGTAAKAFDNADKRSAKGKTPAEAKELKAEKERTKAEKQAAIDVVKEEKHVFDKPGFDLETIVFLKYEEAKAKAMGKILHELEHGHAVEHDHA